MYDGFVERAEAVTRTLADKRTTFVVVSTLESAPVREAEFFVDALQERGLHLGAVILHRVLPSWFLEDGTSDAATVLCPDATRLAGQLHHAPREHAQVGRVVTAVGTRSTIYPGVQEREAPR